MGNGDLSFNLTSGLTADLTLGDLPPASAVGAADEHAAHRDAQGKARRRARPEKEKEEESLDEAGSTSEAGDQPPHQLDRLA